MLDTLLFALGLNAVGFLIAFWRQSDRLTDISYSATFAGIAIYNAVTTEMSVLQTVLLVLVLAWAARLGGFLLYRVIVTGKDRRFDQMRSNFFRFGGFWLLQAVTAWIVMLAVTLLFQENIETSLPAQSVVGISIVVVGLVIEAIADWQKFQFTQNKANKGKWIASGLWKYSRHPNYFGEILVWYGVFTAVAPWLTGTELYVSLVSPLFITAMLLFVSGIPMLEKAADERWGTQLAYQQYKAATSLLIPMKPTKQPEMPVVSSAKTKKTTTAKKPARKPAKKTKTTKKKA